MSDEHAPQFCGCYGHDIVQTPNIDRLAAEGTLFENAYTNCPICVPARAAFMTGRYVHDIEVWDNDSPIDSAIPTIGTYLTGLGYETTLCGRTHFVGADSYHGFRHRLLDDIEKWKHLGKRRAGDRSPQARRYSRSHVTECGPGEENRHVDYDKEATDLAVQFLEGKARHAHHDEPWMLYCGFVNPHFPLLPPEEYFTLYDRPDLPLAKTREEPLEAQHPAIRQLRHWQHGEEPVDEEIERTARAAYYGLITWTDVQIGRILSAIDDSPLKDNTVVLYLSDHGENAGEHGLWQKQCFYEHAVRVPFIARAPGATRGQRIAEDVSLVDVLPTLLGLAGGTPEPYLPGRDLSSTVHGERAPDAPVFSEYHTIGMEHAGYMLKHGRYKYNYYVNHPPQLFDLAADPDELTDLSDDATHASVREELDRQLRAVLDPEALDHRAKENQARDRFNG
jgi:choline-sulfatase